LAQLTGIAVVVQSKTAGQQKWQTEEEFVEDSFADPPITVGEARAAALEAFAVLVDGHNGGTREYRCVQCFELAYEVRPV